MTHLCFLKLENVVINGFWLLAIGFWLLAPGFWLLAFGFWLFIYTNGYDPSGHK